MAIGIFRHPVSDRAEDLVLQARYCDAAVHASHGIRGQRRLAEAESEQLHWPVHRFAVRAGLSEFDQDRRYLDPADAADRLSHGVCDRAHAAVGAQRRHDAGDPAVMDLVPDPRLT
jgi:hypothetical protein